MPDEILPSKGADWSRNLDESSKKEFWWHKNYCVSVWATSLQLPCKPEEATDFEVWQAFIQFRINTVYKLCGVCNGPEQREDFKVCCYCGHSVHQKTCSNEASGEQIAWKAANKGFEKHLVACVACEDEKPREVDNSMQTDGPRRCAIRALALAKEYPQHIRTELERMRRVLSSDKAANRDDDEDMDTIQDLVAQHFQPHNSRKLVERVRIATKNNGFGIRAKKNIPRFTVVGVYPGYDDPLSGEHAKAGRPGPKYSLVDMNCADYFNRVFDEFGKCITPFINEPMPDEKSNVAWIQEPTRPEGRLSVMTVRDIKAGEELLIGYGPLYPRDYPYNYDAYAFHGVDGHSSPPCLALWHWKTTEESDSEFVCYIGYDEDADTYEYWETEDEASSKKEKPAASPAASPTK